MNKFIIKIKKFWHRLFPKCPNTELFTMASKAKTSEDFLNLIGDNELTPSGLTKEEFKKELERLVEWSRKVDKWFEENSVIK